jgi:hypothetical protein
MRRYLSPAVAPREPALVVVEAEAGVLDGDGFAVGPFAVAAEADVPPGLASIS